MAIKTAKLTPEESMAEQAQTFTLEAGTNFADSSRQAVDRLAEHLTNHRVIDLGCGDGAATPFFNDKDIKVIGVDINQQKLDLNPTATINQDMVSYLNAQPNNSLPNIFCHHALEHLPNPQDVIDLIADKLAVGGIVYLEVPANDHLHSVHHATFSTPMDLLPKNFKVLDKATTGEEHYLIARKDHAKLETTTK